MKKEFVKPDHKKNKLADIKSASPKSKRHYVDNAAFYEDCVKFHNELKKNQELGLGRPKMSEFSGECIKAICERLSTMHYFRNYTFREEMVEEGMLNCVQHFDKFDCENFKNPFAYFTQIAYYAFLRIITKERDKIYNSYRLAHDLRFSTTFSELRNDYDDDDPDAPWNEVDDWESESMKRFVDTYEQYKFGDKKKKPKKSKKPSGDENESEEKVEPVQEDPDSEAEQAG